MKDWLTEKDLAKTFGTSICKHCRHWFIGWDMHGGCRIDKTEVDEPLNTCEDFKMEAK